MAVWTLTAKVPGTGECEECGRALVNRYEVTSGNGDRKVVGRGCLKTVTGWTLTAAQAARELRMIGIRAQRTANWTTWSAAHPQEASVILADIKAYEACIPAQFGGGAAHEIRSYVQNAERDLDRLVGNYMNRRHTFGWGA